ncbi:MAG: glycosyltransferase family 2 protein [Acidobacteriota bacterium]|jgi:cellulose synthase/poly-beta-1,6-N-acetylglucosamine synthase-like glycosyltransferase|nr:glycosyltransferase family 2 protein [Acidobacteriota bacterium]
MPFFGPEISDFEKFTQTGNISYLYQMDAFDLTVVAIYFTILGILSFYGLHRYLMVYLYRKHHKKAEAAKNAAKRFEELPRVTVQLPSFNEMYVIERVIDAVCAFDYPHDKLDIQVLDDSTDETRRIASEAVERWRRQGLDICYIHRDDRTGFKAGALENGLKTAKGEFVAVFDADFIPAPDFLQRAVHHFTDPKVGMVQGRWEHLNGDYSFLTRTQSIFLDGHFMLESYTRFLSGRFFNFNGTAGILRRAAIEDAGGWEHDTLTEDLDLSYRAQIKGWKFVFLPDLTVPAELPVEINSFKSQQCRWAKGAMQVCKKTLWKVLRGDFAAGEKLEAWYHLTGNISYPLMILLSLVLFPALIVRYNQGWFELVLIDLPLFILSFSSVSTFYIVSQKVLHKDWLRRVMYLPGLMAVGIGMAIPGAKAVLEGALGIKSPFVRTPKFSVGPQAAAQAGGQAGTPGKPGNEWMKKKYRGGISLLTVLEVLFGLYFAGVVAYAWQMEIYGVIPFLLLFMCGYLYTGLWALAQSLKRLWSWGACARLFAPLRFWRQRGLITSLFN